jgi:hypothetical protein
MIFVDNLIFGTFPDLPGSQQVVHRTPGISPAVEAELLRFYNDFGDCKSESFESSISVLWIEAKDGDEPLVAVSKVSQMGKDFSGRWGALLRHSAVFRLSDYRKMMFCPAFVSDHLVSSGTAEALRDFDDILLEQHGLAAAFLEQTSSLSFAPLKENLRRLMSGDRLIVYSEINTTDTNRYIRQLASLLPMSFSMSFNWSEFLFRPLENIDLLIAYNGRYEPPSGDSITLSVSGRNSLSNIDLHEEYIDDYISLLEDALARHDVNRLGDLLCDLP